MGGGTDYPSWYENHGGAVLTMTIDKYCHVLLREMPAFLGNKYIVFWSQMEKVDTIEEIKHPGVRGCLQYLNIDLGVEVNHAGDLPARSGLGSSSSFTVAMLKALHALKNEEIGRSDLAREAIHVEQSVLKETVGIQDQIACSWGGLNKINIETDGSYGVYPVSITPEKMSNLQDWLVLCFTGLQRYASDIATEQVNNTVRNENALKEIRSMVPIAHKILTDGAFEEFGELLHESWLLKRQLSSKVTNDSIDEIYNTARKHGAIGGKVLGAGGGGFMLFCVPPDRREEMLAKLGLLSIPVCLSHNGAEVVHIS